MKLEHDGRTYNLDRQPSGWRMRRRKKGEPPVIYRTGTLNLSEARKRCRKFLDEGETSRQGGGSLEKLVEVYLAAPKRASEKSAKGNVSRLRSIVRLTWTKELDQMSCRQLGPDFWRAYQVAACAAAEVPFDLSSRLPEHIPINSAVRQARAIVIPRLHGTYREAGLDVPSNAQEVDWLLVPYVPPVEVDDIVEAWAELPPGDPLWVAVGLARFAGLRRSEIQGCRGGWIQEDGATYVVLRDRPEEGWWSKTGKPYRALVINPELAAWLVALGDRPALIQSANWYRRTPQAWLKGRGIATRKPLHRLRGLYADDVLRLTQSAVAAQAAGLAAAQAALGHSSSETTEKHYLSPDALQRP